VLPTDSYTGLEFYDCYEVDPDTVGEFTGLTDRCGVKIFEGDILIYIDPDTSEYDESERYIVQWDEEDVGFTTEAFYCGKSQGLVALLRHQSINHEIIGNIHDNPELLEGDDDR